MTSLPTPSPSAAANRLLAFPAGMPERFECAGRSYRFVRQFKHDFFAATGLYVEDHPRQQDDQPGSECLRLNSERLRLNSERLRFRTANEHADLAKSQANTEPTEETTHYVVLKIQRTRPFFGAPLGWLGGWLTRHEATIYRELADMPNVPGFVGFFGPTGFVHEFVPGHPLHREDKLPDAFFGQLADLLAALHARGLAYVDLNKRQNILVGDDGRPHLIDFQISFRLGRRGGAMPRAILKTLQEHDWHHFGKHKRRCRPDQMTPAAIAASYERSGLLNLHRTVSRPYFWVRRWVLDRLRLPRGDEAEG